MPYFVDNLSNVLGAAIALLVSKIGHAKVILTSRTNCKFGNELWIILTAACCHIPFGETDLVRKLLKIAFLEKGTHEEILP